jgi:DtxR family Mn-dependent transcriptional regulator
MIQKLSDMDFVKYEPYHGVSLTTKGRKIAKDLFETHKTLASFLMIIGVDEETAESDACQIEHNVTPRTMKQLTKFVDYIQGTTEKPRWLKRFKGLGNSKDISEE